jgi:hypothetical protein
MFDLYGDAFFVESPELARYLAERTTTSDRLGILASEPQICFYAHRISASPHLYMYPLTENQPYALALQNELIADFEHSKPKFIVYTGDQNSWFLQPGAPTKVFDWAKVYLTEHYYLVGRIECNSDITARFAWDNDMLAIPPSSGRWIGIYRRKAGHQ